MTVTPNGSPFWLYFERGNSWVHLDGVLPGVDAPSTRPSSVWLALDGTARAQVAQRENRTWALAFSYEDAECSRWLERAARNPGAVWLYDAAAGMANMLDDRTTEGTLLTATQIVWDGVSFLTFQAGDTFTRKVRSGVTYFLSFTTNATAGSTLGTYKVGAAAAVNVVAPSGTGVRRGSVSFTPGSNADVVVVWTVSNKASAAQLTELNVQPGWVEGQNTPCQVVVQKGGRKAQQAFADRPALFDRSFSLQEVG